MSRVYVGNLDPRVTERELEDEFRKYGVIRSVWVARRPPGYAFIDFDDRRDAEDAIREIDGKNGWRVELSHNSRGGSGGGGSRGGGGGRGEGRGRSGGSDLKCYECGEAGHFARECRMRGGGGGGGGRRRSRSRSPPRYRRSPSYGRRSYSPRARSPRRRSVTPRGRSYSRSPPYRGREEVRAREDVRVREEVPYTNGNGRRQAGVKYCILDTSRLRVFRSLITMIGLEFYCMFKWVTPLARLVILVSSLASTHEFG